MFSNGVWMGVTVRLNMQPIFISYRRDDCEGQAGRLFNDLVRSFGKRFVFMDVASIPPGRDFRKVIDEKIASCGVLLTLIGQHWLDERDEGGSRRLDNPTDFVRLEIAAALKRDIPVIPVFVQGAKMPCADQLPEELHELAYRTAVELTHARWDSDVEILIGTLKEASSVGPQPGKPANFARRLRLGLALFAGASLIAVASYMAIFRPTVSVISYVRDDGRNLHGEFNRNGAAWIETFPDLKEPRHWIEVANPPKGKLRLSSGSDLIEIDFATNAIDYSEGTSPLRRLDIITSVARK